MAFFRSSGILNSSKGFFGGVVVGGGGGGGGGGVYPTLDGLINLSELRVRWTGNRSRGRVSTSVRNGTFYDPGNPFSANESWEIAGAVRNVGATGFEVEYDGSFINPAYVPYMSHYKWQDWSTNSSFDPGYDDPANHYFGSLWEFIIGDAASLADSTYGGLPNPCLLRMFIGWDKYYWLDSRWSVDYPNPSKLSYRPEIDRLFDPPIGVLNEFAVFV